VVRAGGAAVFVGRERELGELERLLDAVEAGAGAAVLVGGDAGIGKTRLASAATRRARDRGFEVLVGRSIDLVGSELPYQPFVEALRPVGGLREPAGSQLRVFEETLALLTERTAAAPVLLLLEDVHWADASTLDLAVFLAHNVEDRRLLLLATYRRDEPASAGRMRRLEDGVRRSGAGLLLELAPLARAEMIDLLAAHADGPPPAALADAIATRSEGNPFFAEELLAASDRGGELPAGLRDLLLQRVERLDGPTRGLLRVAAAAGRDVSYRLLHALAERPEREVRDSLREAVEHGVLVADLGAGSFRFRHALLAEAVYSTILPGEREELHARLAEELGRSGAASAAELAPHWAAAGRPAEALSASLAAARESEAVFGLAEARVHLERALALWDVVPGAAELAGQDLAELCLRTARLASQVGAAAPAAELAQRAIELVGDDDPYRAGRLHVLLAEDLYATGRDDAALAELERAVEVVPAEPPSSERAYAVASLAGGLMIARRRAESLATAEQALALARAVGAREAEVRALTVLGSDLSYLGSAEAGLARFQQALRLAEEIDDRWGLERVYVNLTDALTMLGRLRESARVGAAGLEALRRYGINSALVVANQVETLVALGDWDEADRLSAAALRSIASSYQYGLLIVRALVESERGELDAARAHLEAAQSTLRRDRGHGLYDRWVADVALWERRWTDADRAIQDAVEQASHPDAAQIRVQVCATGLRAQAELAALARVRRDGDDLRNRLRRARELLSIARSAAAEASAITPVAAGWLAQAEAEHLRVRGEARPDAWSETAALWERLERPPLAAYCRWRQVEALVASGASRGAASAPLREAHAVASRLGAKPLLRELELLAERARLELAPSSDSLEGEPGPERLLGLTRREAEVLRLVARGYTNREIAAELVISVKTAGVHVQHILRKLDAPNRREAAAIAHRLALPG